MIDLSSACDSTAVLIRNSFVIFIIYLWIKIKLKVLLFPTSSSSSALLASALRGQDVQGRIKHRDTPQVDLSQARQVRDTCGVLGESGKTQLPSVRHVRLAQAKSVGEIFGRLQRHQGVDHSERLDSVHREQGRR
jgi:hypothetical protein